MNLRIDPVVMKDNSITAIWDNGRNLRTRTVLNELYVCRREKCKEMFSTFVKCLLTRSSANRNNLQSFPYSWGLCDYLIMTWCICQNMGHKSSNTRKTSPGKGQAAARPRNMATVTERLLRKIHGDRFYSWRVSKIYGTNVLHLKKKQSMLVICEWRAQQDSKPQRKHGTSQ